MKFQWPLSFKSNSITRVQLGNLAEWFKYRTSSGTSLDEQSAIEVTAVLCAVRVIAEGIAQMPLRIRKKELRNKRVYSPDVPDHWAWDLLVKKPNSWMTPYEFREYAVFLAVLFGDFVAVKNGPSDGKITELLPLIPGSWEIKQDAKFNLTYEVSLAGGVKQTFKSSQIFHFRGPSINGYSGLKPVQLARDSIALADSLEGEQINLSKNGGRPSGVLSSETGISKEKAEQIKTAWTEKFGSNGDGGIALLDGGWKFSPMQMTAVDSQHLETRKFQIEEIARSFRVFPQMLMQSDKTSTFGSAESFFRAHVTHTLGPWVERFEDVIDRDILAGEEDLFADLDERNLLRGDFKDQSEYYAKALGAGGTPAWMTQNDVRSEVGLEPLDDANADRLFNGFQDQASGNTENEEPDNDDGA